MQVFGCQDGYLSSVAWGTVKLLPQCWHWNEDMGRPDYYHRGPEARHGCAVWPFGV